MNNTTDDKLRIVIVALQKIKILFHCEHMQIDKIRFGLYIKVKIIFQSKLFKCNYFRTGIILELIAY